MGIKMTDVLVRRQVDITPTELSTKYVPIRGHLGYLHSQVSQFRDK